MDPSAVQVVQAKYAAVRDGLNEFYRRRWAAAEARALGRGGPTVVAAATGLSLPTIRKGSRELSSGVPASPERQRRCGAGRKALTVVDRSLLDDLESLVDPVTRGDPTSPLRWTCKSTAKLAQALASKGHRVSARTVERLLHQLHYSLQAVRKTREGKQHPDRDVQFEHINAQVKDFQARGLPVISVDTKKKELVGAFKNAGREWRPEGSPEEVNVYDFPDLADAKAVPYGVYDIGRDRGWVSVGTDHDTPAFAVATIRAWWMRMGKSAYPHADALMITADSGGSNGARPRRWKVELQALANETGLKISVCHFPPGTSKWNKIEHRMFCRITENWRARPLVSLQTVVNLIANTHTANGTRIRARLDAHKYPLGEKTTDAEFKALHIERDDFHGNWNYTLVPSETRSSDK